MCARQIISLSLYANKNVQGVQVQITDLEIANCISD